MWFGKLKGLLKASHFGPTLLVTAISFGFATYYWWEGPAYVIAFGVFTGQLVVGWSNDLYDYQDDLSHNRKNKPLVSGQITEELLQNWLKWVIPFSFIANLLGPLGVKGGLVYMLGIACGVAYNFYFKFSLLSPLPYAIACAALPACVFYGLERTPPLWILVTGSLLGVAFHLLNVLKDLSQDRESNIGGLPQRMGKKYSLFAVFFLLTLILFTVIVLR